MASSLEVLHRYPTSAACPLREIFSNRLEGRAGIPAPKWAHKNILSDRHRPLHKKKNSRRCSRQKKIYSTRLLQPSSVRHHVVTYPRVSIPVLVSNQSHRHFTLHFQTPHSLFSRPPWSLKRPSNMALLLSHNVYCACVKCVGHACEECL